MEIAFSELFDNLQQLLGGFMSQYFDLPYNSPFVGLFVFAPDYLRLLSDLKNYLSLDLVFIKADSSKYASELKKYGTFGKYPIGMIGDVELHFLHYRDNFDAQAKWTRRKERINYEFLIIKFCDRDLATPNLIQEFDKINFQNKICLTAGEHKLYSCIRLNNELGNCVENEWENFLDTISPMKLMLRFKP